MFACLLGILAIAGCGGGAGEARSSLSKQDYEGQMQTLQADLERSVSKLEKAFSNPQDAPAISTGLTDAADIFDEASSSLDEIEPPDDVAEPHQVMVEETASAAAKIRGIADRVKDASTGAEIANELTEFSTLDELTDLQQAVDDIQAAGYDIGGSGSSG